MPDGTQTSAANRYGWIDTETVKSRLGDFPFRNGYPELGTAERLRDALIFNRAVEVYLTQMHGVSWYNVWKGTQAAGDQAPNQLVLWQDLMDSETLLLTGNTETVYGLVALDLARDGPVVIEAPAGLLGGINDLWQTEILGVGPTGADKGQGGRFLLLPPDYDGPIPDGYIVGHSLTTGVMFGVRGFQSPGGGTAHAAELIRGTKVYPLSQAASPPPLTVFNGSRQEVDTLFADDIRYFEDLAWLIETQPHDVVPSHERFMLAAIGIEKGKPFAPDAQRRRTLDEAAHFASAIARTNSFASDDPEALVYPDRKWEWAFVGGSATWDSQGYVNTDRRAGFAYIAIGMSPAMVDKHVGVGSQYLWTPRDGSGKYLDGAKTYRLRLPPDIPAKNFWSVVMYDADSRSIARNGQPFPSVGTYTNPQANPDGSIDVVFGPDRPQDGANWIRTVPGKGWFVLLRFYGPLEPFFDKSWKPDDIVAV